jgi:hypothetical protein
MPSSNKPRKKYTPKNVGIPMGIRHADRLVISPLIALNMFASDTCDGENAHTLLCYLNVAFRVMDVKNDERKQLVLDAMLTIREALDVDEDYPKLPPEALKTVRVGVEVADHVCQVGNSAEWRKAIDYVYKQVNQGDGDGYR